MICAAVLSAGAAFAEGGPECQIHIHKRDGLLVIQAVASSNIPDAGRYALQVTKQSGGGVSRSLQQGEFSLQPRSETILSTTAVEAAAEGHISARLTVTSKRGVSTCTFPN